jgi:hypothetical protein
MEFRGVLRSGAGTTSQGADANLLSIRNANTTRFIFDAEGSAHADVEWIAFDDHDDAGLLMAFETALQTKIDPLRQNFGEWMTENRRKLQELRLVTFNEDGHHFVNFTRLNMLLCGAVRQLADQARGYEKRLAGLETMLLPAY